MENFSDESSAFLENKNEQIESNYGERTSETRRLSIYDSIPRYSEREAEALTEKLANEETFREAQQVLITWLEEGQCDEKNSMHFVYLIQLCWDRLEKLQTKEKECLKEAQKAQESLVNYVDDIQIQLCEIEELFKTIENENIWNNFTPNQIDDINEMRKDILDFKKDISKGSVVEESSGMKYLNNEDILTENVACKLQAKVGCLATGSNAVDQEYEDLKTRYKECGNKKFRKRRQKKKSIFVGDKQQKNSDVSSQCNLDHQTEVHIISLLSIFLFNHPGGVNTGCIHSYLSRYFPTIFAREIENLMRRFPKIFKESSPIGSIQEKKWTCVSVSRDMFFNF